jgi:hypothetical protein
MIKMAEELQNAQIDQSKTAQKYMQRDTRRGHWLGWVTVVLAMAGAVGCVWLDYPWVASVFLSLPVMAVAKSLIETVRTSQSPASQMIQPTGGQAAGSAESGEQTKSEKA